MYRDEITLWDIWKAANAIIQFTEGFDFEGFLKDEKTRSAVLHQIMIIGEAVKRIRPDYRSAHPEISWKDMAGMRDRLIHFYEGVDLNLVWLTATEHVPALISKLEPLLPELPEE